MCTHLQLHGPGGSCKAHWTRAASVLVQHESMRSAAEPQATAPCVQEASRSAEDA